MWATRRNSRRWCWRKNTITTLHIFFRTHVAKMLEINNKMGSKLRLEIIYKYLFSLPPDVLQHGHFTDTGILVNHTSPRASNSVYSMVSFLSSSSGSAASVTPSSGGCWTSGASSLGARSRRCRGTSGVWKAANTTKAKFNCVKSVVGRDRNFWKSLKNCQPVEKSSHFGPKVTEMIENRWWFFGRRHHLVTLWTLYR